MAPIDRIIQRNPNPFDAETFWSGNFWQERQNPDLTIESIHRDAIAALEGTLDRVAADRRSRTLLLQGETGSGKTYLLGRLRRLLNPKAFFVYIEPFTASDFIWRHILRYTVDSLLEVPEGQQESQLILWLKGLSAFNERNPFNLFRDDRQEFVRRIRNAYPSGMYNAHEFFGVLYDLINPRLYRTACEWLRGDDLDEDSLRSLRVQSTIETEDAAQKMLANFGRISIETNPIVLCFDQLDNIARLSDGSIDLPTLFNVNTIFHNQKLKNFLVVISIITDTWRQNAHRISATDRDRANDFVQLRQIPLEQAEALWVSRLYPLHRQANPIPTSALHPLSRQMLEEKFPGGKTKPRNVLMLGRQLYQDYKMRAVADVAARESKPEAPLQAPAEAAVEPLAAFKLVWLKKLKQTQQRIDRIRQIASPELIAMLGEAIASLDIATIEARLLQSPTYGNYSIAYRLKERSHAIGIVWTEDPNLNKFCNVMKACQDAIESQNCRAIYLIRAEGIGKPANQGYKLCQQIFSGNPHQRVIPDLASVRSLAAYHALVNDAASGELVVGDRTPDIKALESLAREANIWQDCALLKNLGLLLQAATQREGASPPGEGYVNSPYLKATRDFLQTRLLNQQCMARQQLLREAVSQFPEAAEAEIDALIDEICNGNGRIKILDPQAKLEEQLIYAIEREISQPS